MGWKETSVLEERLHFVQEYRSGEWSKAEACRRAGVSRMTGYKWLDRYAEGGVEALRDRSRAPHTRPRQVLEEVEEVVVEARGQHPHWGNCSRPYDCCIWRGRRVGAGWRRRWQ